MLFLRNLILFILVGILSYVFSSYIGDFYVSHLRTSTPTLDLRGLIGLLEGYMFFFPFIFRSLGDKNMYWWFGFLFIPPAVIILYLSISIIYLPILLSTGGFLLGYGLNKLKEYVLSQIKKPAQKTTP